MSKLRVVVGGQFGSESKGRTTGFLTQEDVTPAKQLVIRVGGPQAGHIVTGPGPDGPEHHWKLRTVPVASVTRHDALLAIASGSEVEINQLNKEISQLDEYGYGVGKRLVIDPRATWLTPDHKQREVDSTLVGRIGSTATGVGAARVDRVMRVAETAADHRFELGDRVMYEHSVGDLAAEYLRSGMDVVIEAAQGCHLDLYRGTYPFTTSGRTTAIDALSAAEVIPWQNPKTELQIWIACRVNPIRVGGNSGPLANETDWDALGVEPERTTVTNRIRRVAEWDPKQVADSVRWCGGPPTVRLSMSHLDYLFPEVADAKSVDDFSDEALYWLKSAEDECGAYIGLVGVSPSKTIVFREGLL